MNALEGSEGSVSRPGRSLPLGETRYPMYRGLGGPQGCYGQVRKISPPLGFDPRTVQLIASHYTDYATWLTNISKGWSFLQEWNNSNTFVVIGNKVLDSLHAYCNHKEVSFLSDKKEVFNDYPSRATALHDSCKQMEIFFHRTLHITLDFGEDYVKNCRLIHSFFTWMQWLQFWGYLNSWRFLWHAS
jgi:hypothetical protein